MCGWITGRRAEVGHVETEEIGVRICKYVIQCCRECLMALDTGRRCEGSWKPGEYDTKSYVHGLMNPSEYPDEHQYVFSGLTKEVCPRFPLSLGSLA